MQMEIDPLLPSIQPLFPRKTTVFLDVRAFLSFQSSLPGTGPVLLPWNISLAQKTSPPGALSLWCDANTSISAVTHSLQIDSFQEVCLFQAWWGFSHLSYSDSSTKFLLAWMSPPTVSGNGSNCCVLFFIFFSSQLSFLHWFILCILKKMSVHINYGLFQAISSLGIEDFSGIKAATLVLARKGNAGF